METAYLVLNTFAMPLPGLPFPRAPYRYSNRGHIIAYHSSRAELVSWSCCWLLRSTPRPAL